ncbi:phytanoyl-CoA dioxygenase family protein [Bythopirellula polymerisocia]|uniref:Phytanoyl-CoA dioxygenase (PhyH) n=1 Tax=Bythopirellula polymerisocia TaxID=2528003 RepID=A0A5C6CZI8_9BACT|nr:Phytanoyl-CoA dioxygenase (PhyH) [Bythopirellula polymerisocia]
MSKQRAQFAEQGFCIVKQILTSTECNRLAGLFHGHHQAGIRDLFSRFIPIRELVRSRPIRKVVDRLCGPAAFAVRAILFDKSPLSNWFVAWHQDLNIAVKEKHLHAGYGPWSVKEEIVHVCPPIEILRRMVTLRLHLDACLENNGPLKVIPRSHKHGSLDQVKTQNLISQIEPISCIALAGDCVVISPLILHASSKSTNPQHRRVLHIEFANVELPVPLQWYERW